MKEIHMITTRKYQIFFVVIFLISIGYSKIELKSYSFNKNIIYPGDIVKLKIKLYSKEKTNVNIYLKIGEREYRYPYLISINGLTTLYFTIEAPSSSKNISVIVNGVRIGKIPLIINQKIYDFIFECDDELELPGIINLKIYNIGNQEDIYKINFLGAVGEETEIKIKPQKYKILNLSVYSSDRDYFIVRVCSLHIGCKDEYVKVLNKKQTIILYNIEKNVKLHEGTFFKIKLKNENNYEKQVSLQVNTNLTYKIYPSNYFTLKPYEEKEIYLFVYGDRLGKHRVYLNIKIGEEIYKQTFELVVYSPSITGAFIQTTESYWYYLILLPIPIVLIYYLFFRKPQKKEWKYYYSPLKVRK